MRISKRAGIVRAMAATVLIAVLAGCGGSAGSDQVSSFATRGLSVSNAGLAGADGADNGGGAGGPRGPVSGGNGQPVPFPSDGNGSILLPEFAIYVAQSPPSPDNFNPGTWAGVLGFLQQSDGTSLSLPGIPAAELNDPSGLAFRDESSELFVTNRHGNQAIGSDGSISRFVYDPDLRTFTANGTIPLSGPGHGIAFNPVDGELFVGLVGPDFFFAGGVQRFTFDGGGAAIENIAGFLNVGTVRGVAVSPDGERLYVTTAGNVIRQFDLANNNAELTPVNVSGAPNLHYMEVLSNELYVAALGSDQVLRYAIESNNDLTFRDSFVAQGAVDVAFSPDGQEMLVSGHTTSDVIHRFTYDSANDTWVPLALDNLSTGTSLGGIQTLP